MKSLTALGVATLLSVASSATIAQTATASTKPAAKPAASTAAKPAAKPAAKTQAPLTQATESVNTMQLDIAKRVHTGNAACEFDQTVSVTPVANQPGHFSVGYKNASYTMVPEATSTGAVRLEDKKAGVVWLQIANKSMLMNSKIGQRMVDSCVHPAQSASTSTGRAPLLQ